MSPSEFFKPNLAKVLWLTAFFVVSFEAFWIQTICLKNTCQAWYFRLPFWAFAWPFYFIGKLPSTGIIYVILEIIFFIAIPFLYYYLLACLAARFLSKTR
jgi:hypothetical protein